MLQRLRLRDFKSFADATVELAPLTLLVGANASGKSNFLDALRFLAGTQVDQTFEEILNGDKDAGSNGSWPGLRGGAAEAARVGASRFTIDSVWSVADEQSLGPARVTVEHGMTCRTRPRPRLEGERMATESGEELFRTGAVENDWILVSAVPALPIAAARATGLDAAELSLQTMVTTERSVIWNWFFTAEALRVSEIVKHHTKAIALALHHTKFLDLQPADMRGYGRVGAELGDTGRGLSAALYSLCSDPDDKGTLLELLVALCAPELADIDFVHVEEMGDVMAMLVEKDGRRISARSLSDGTLRFLGTVVALYTAKPNSVLCFEEIAAGLHPARIQVLVSWLQTVCRERDIQIIATTHSPAVLQWLDEQSLGDVVLCARSPEHDGTILRRFRDLPDFADVVRHAGVEEMFTTSWLELAV